MRSTLRLLVPAALAVTLLATGTLAAPAKRPTHDGTASSTSSAASELNNRVVLLISVDGLSRRVIKRLGRDRLPNIHGLLRRGVSTANARTQSERTTTLPNHVSMVTGRRIRARAGGHGVTWNHNAVKRTVHTRADGWVASAFTQVHRAGGRTAVFATKKKFSILERSWPAAVHRNMIRDGRYRAVTRRLCRHLANRLPSFAVLHLGGPDRAGHGHGWMSRPYRRAVRRADRRIGKVLQTRRDSPQLRRRLAIILTADHGGVPRTTSHTDARHPQNYRVPFSVTGRGAGRGNVYALSPDYQRPRSDWYPAVGQQPVRNGDAANVAMDLLGLAPVPDSLWGTDQQLNLR